MVQSRTIETGYRPGLIGHITELHARYYAAHHGFGSAFESKVAVGLADFVMRLGNSANAIWCLVENQRILGSIAIDGEDLGGHIAHLRWFILDDTVKGTGFGRILLNAALQHCSDQRFREVHLWTFSGLDAARKLYEANGFSLVEEYSGNQWGKTVTEQKFGLKLSQQR